jgi:hypothetical protein
VNDRPEFRKLVEEVRARRDAQRARGQAVMAKALAMVKEGRLTALDVARLQNERLRLEGEL